MFKGSYTALITPFLENGDIDEEKFRTFLKKQFSSNLDGVVPVGTTGESPTLNHAEHNRIVEITVEEKIGNKKIIAGTGSNSAREAVALSKSAEKIGADACLVVTPYYNKPNQDGLFQYYKAISEATALPIILYNIPGRCVIEIEIDTVLKIADELKNVVAIKEAGGDVQRVEKLRSVLPENFEILSGDDPLTIPFMEKGAVGAISVASNLIPNEIASITNAMLENKTDEAKNIFAKYSNLLTTMMQIDVNPLPIKTALAIKGQVLEKFRLPLCKISNEKRNIIENLLKNI